MIDLAYDIQVCFEYTTLPFETLVFLSNPRKPKAITIQALSHVIITKGLKKCFVNNRSFITSIGKRFPFLHVTLGTF